MLTLFVILYVFLSVVIGLYASRNIKSADDYILAGRSLSMTTTIATVFATWFGSEAILGIPAVFIEKGLTGLFVEPLGAGLCLVFVGIFFAAKLYRMNLMTIGDFYRQRYGRKVEVLVSVIVCISYLGWLSAQIVALGMVIHLVSYESLSIELSMLIGISAVMLYTVTGGMKAVAITDFFQMIIIFLGLVSVAFLVANNFEGGVAEVVFTAAADNKFAFWPNLNITEVLLSLSAFLTLALGSIPQQDIFQRVMSAKNEKIAVRGTIIGGLTYIVFCGVPIFITYGVSLLEPNLFQQVNSTGVDLQNLLPTFILQKTPMLLQILFFGALLSAIMSTASGTLLAPSAVVAENILKDMLNLTDKGLVKTLRICMVVFGLIVYGYAYISSSAGHTIVQMVKNAYLITLCGAFVPLAFGVYWKKATQNGALLSMAFGIGSWATVEILNLFFLEEPLAVPSALLGLSAGIGGMILGSLLNAPAWKRFSLYVNG